MMDTQTLGRSLLFYSTNDPVIIINVRGQFIDENAAAEDVFGKSFPRYGQSLDHMESIAALLNVLKKTGTLHTAAEPIKFGERIFDPRALAIESPIQTKNNLLGWSISLVDITERERMAEQLRTAVAHAEAANIAKSQFLAMISHELRTPMTSVKGGLDLALGGYANDISDPVKNLLGIAQRNSVRLLRLIDDVLDLQKLELNTINLELQDLNPDTFLRDLLEEYEAYATGANVGLSVSSGDVKTLVRADPYRLKQVVGNIISNAVKFSPQGGQVVCSAQLVGVKLRVSVQDSGVGIPNNEEDQVFGKFNQVEGSSSQAPGGSGLGMHIAKLLIERMGGCISYDSQLGVGTTFHVGIPLSLNTVS
jgi:signal transduction histidine kinase